MDTTRIAAEVAANKDKPASAVTRDVGGHIWRIYRTSIGVFEWRTDGGRWIVGGWGNRSTYWAKVNGEFIPGAGGKPKRFPNPKAAMLAAVKL